MPTLRPVIQYSRTMLPDLKNHCAMELARTDLIPIGHTIAMIVRVVSFSFYSINAGETRRLHCLNAQ